MNREWKKAIRRLNSSGYPRGRLQWQAFFIATGVSHRPFGSLRRAKAKLWAEVERQKAAQAEGPDKQATVANVA